MRRKMQHLVGHFTHLHSFWQATTIKKNNIPNFSCTLDRKQTLEVHHTLSLPRLYIFSYLDIDANQNSK